MNRRLLTAIILFCTTSALAPTARAISFQVTVDTSPIQGVAGFAAFDFIGGSPIQNNTATVLNFATDGTLGLGVSSGDVSEFEVDGLATCAASDVSTLADYRTPTGAFKTSIKCSSPATTLDAPLTIKWTLKYRSPSIASVSPR